MPRRMYRPCAETAAYVDQGWNRGIANSKAYTNDATTALTETILEIPNSQGSIHIRDHNKFGIP